MKAELFGDRERLEDMLLSQRYLCGAYNCSAMKCISKKLHDEMTTLLYEEHKLELEIVNELLRRGAYDTELADNIKVAQVKQEYSVKLLAM